MYISADSLEDAMLQARKVAAQSNESQVLFLIFDTLGDHFSRPCSHNVLVGVPGKARHSTAFSLTLDAGLYASVHFQNREESRRQAIALLGALIKEKSLRPLGPMLNCGSLIDPYTASCWDYCIETQIRVGPAETDKSGHPDDTIVLNDDITSKGALGMTALSPIRPRTGHRSS